MGDDRVASSITSLGHRRNVSCKVLINLDRHVNVREIEAKLKISKSKNLSGHDRETDGHTDGHTDGRTWFNRFSRRADLDQWELLHPVAR